MILATAALCLSMNIYMEARGENFQGQVAVAQVTLNRAGRHMSQVCDVVAAKDQFSWTKGKLIRRHGKLILLKKYEPKEEKAWKMAQIITSIVVKGYTQNIVYGARFYHADYVHPYWASQMRLVNVIGHHLFYRMD